MWIVSNSSLLLWDAGRNEGLEPLKGPNSNMRGKNSCLNVLFFWFTNFFILDIDGE